MASEVHHKPDLHGFFNPSSIAVVGASADSNKPGGKIIELLRHFQFPGRIFPVNPGRKEIQGLACYSNLAEIKYPVDLVVIALAAKQVPEAVRSCAALSLHNIVVISAGFAELGAEGAALQAELRELVQRYGLNLLGPNCIGFVNALLPAAAAFSLAVDSGELRQGPVAIVAQSGGLGVLALYLADLEHIGISYMINTGNEAGLDFASIISFLVREPAVKVIGGYLEGAVDGSRLRRSFREAAEAGKPVILLKAGDSREAIEAISSHTGALAGSREAYQAVFRQEGVLPVSTMTEMISLLKAFASGRLPKGNRVGVFALSGGMGVLTADLCSAAGLQLARFEDKTKRELRRLLPSIATVRNPLDATAAMVSNLDGIEASLKVLLADPGVDILVFATAFWRHFGTRAVIMLERLISRTDKPVILIWPGCNEETRLKLQEKGLFFYREAREGIAAAASLWRYAAFLNSRAQPVQAREDRATALSPQVKAAVALPHEKMELTEVESKEILKAWGLPVPRGAMVETVDEAAEAARVIGYPVVLKVVSRAISHKTEAGGVALGLTDEVQLRAAWSQMRKRLQEIEPALIPDGFLVEEMLPVQTELLVGVRFDDVFGPLLVVSPGGILVELFQDKSIRPAPVSPSQALEMAGELKSAPLLQGYRGAGPVDLKQLAEIISSFSHLAWELRHQFKEMEINPLIIGRDGSIAAADALFIRSCRDSQRLCPSPCSR